MRAWKSSRKAKYYTKDKDVYPYTNTSTEGEINKANLQNHI